VWVPPPTEATAEQIVEALGKHAAPLPEVATEAPAKEE
jgi:hypothetical protein